MRRVGRCLKKAFGNEAIGDPLHCLSGDSHLAADPGHGQRLSEDSPHHLPPSDRNACGFSEFIPRGQHLTIELEDRQSELAAEL